MIRHAFKLAPFVALAELLMISGATASDVNDLHWMSGCWALDGQEHGSVENWMQPAGGSMLGMNRIISDDETVAFEYMRIITDDRGDTTLIATPSGQPEARFKLLSLSEHEVVFENPDHDFPQRITYKLESEDRLAASISGNINGSSRTVKFPMTRTECVNGIEAN